MGLEKKALRFPATLQLMASSAFGLKIVVECRGTGIRAGSGTDTGVRIGETRLHVGSVFKP